MISTLEERATKSLQSTSFSLNCFSSKCKHKMCVSITVSIKCNIKCSFKIDFKTTWKWINITNEYKSALNGQAYEHDFDNDIHDSHYFCAPHSIGLVSLCLSLSAFCIKRRIIWPSSSVVPHDPMSLPVSKPIHKTSNIFLKSRREKQGEKLEIYNQFLW